MRFGVSRHGPFAPLARQFGKYDALTTTGTPVRETWKLMSSLPLRIFVTFTSGSGVPVGARSASAPGARFHDAGPDAASGRSRLPTLSNQPAARHSHGSRCTWVTPGCGLVP